MTSVKPRPGVLNIRPHMVGFEEPTGVERIIKLASNESALGPSPKALQAARHALAEAHRYPESGTGDLQEAIAARFALDPTRIVCGPGSDELLSRVVRAYLGPGDEMIRSANGYAKFTNYAHAVNARTVSAPDVDLRADVKAILACVNERTRMVTIANPDNPSGSLLKGEAIRHLHAGLPKNVLLVLDSAYAEYVRDPEYEPASRLVEEAENVAMTRTFSKLFGMAAMRLGWLYASTAIVDAVTRIGSTFPVTGPSMAAGIAAVGDTDHMAYIRAHNDTWLPWLSEELTARGLHVYPSDTNFVLIRFDDSRHSAADAHQFLLTRGIIARLFPQPAFRQCMRVTIGLDDEMKATVDALGDFLDS